MTSPRDITSPEYSKDATYCAFAAKEVKYAWQIAESGIPSDSRDDVIVFDRAYNDCMDSRGLPPSQTTPPAPSRPDQGKQL